MTLILIYAAALTVAEGFLLRTLWAWFIVGRFDAHPISVGEAIGISVAMGVLTHQYNPSADTSKMTLTEKCARYLIPIVSLLVSLGVAYIAHCYA